MATRSPPSSRTALSLLSPPRRATSGCRALYGSERSKPAWLACWRRSGPSAYPALRARVLLGERAGVVFGNRSPDCGRCRVRRRPSARSWWTRIAQHPRGSERPRPLVLASRRPSSAMTSKRESQSCSAPRKSLRARDCEISRNLVQRFERPETWWAD